MSMKSNPTRPGVLDNASSTQMDEMERAVSDEAKEYFNRLTHSYGWDKQTGEQVWEFMSHRVSESEVDQAFEEGKGQSPSTSS